MHFVSSVRQAARVVVATAFVAFAFQASAQEIPESHIKAAKAAISAVRATDAYDNILPAAAIAPRASRKRSATKALISGV